MSSKRLARFPVRLPFAMPSIPPGPVSRLASLLSRQPPARRVRSGRAVQVAAGRQTQEDATGQEQSGVVPGALVCLLLYHPLPEQQGSGARWQAGFVVAQGQKDRQGRASLLRISGDHRPPPSFCYCGGLAMIFLRAAKSFRPASKVT